MAQTDDKDLPPTQALIEEFRTCSVEKSSTFHLLRATLRMAITEGQDELIKCVGYYLRYAENIGSKDYLDLINETVASIERKKREAAGHRQDATFVSALGDDGDGENRFHE